MRSRTLAVAIAILGTSSVLLMILAASRRDLVMGQVAVMLSIATCIPVGVWCLDLVGERRHEETVQRVLRIVGRADAESEMSQIGRRR